MNSSVSNCPVPVQQQPLNEYEELKSSWLFRDCTLNWQNYVTKMLVFLSIFGVIASPIAAASFPPHKHIGEFIFSSAAGGSLGVLLILIRLYLGWSYVRDRLVSPIIFYEESGWYDGQTWAKPEEVLTRDRLIVSYEIKPIIQRLQLTFGCLATLFIVGSIVWHLL